MPDKNNEKIIKIINDIEAEYEKTGGDLTKFLLAYFFPKIDTKSDYITDDKGRYECQCSFAPSAIKSVKKSLNTLVKYLEIEHRYNSFFVFIDIKEAKIPNDCDDEEYGSHLIWYGDESDYYFYPVKTKVVLEDDEVFEAIKEEDPYEYQLVLKIRELYEELTKRREVL